MAYVCSDVVQQQAVFVFVRNSLNEYCLVSCASTYSSFIHEAIRFEDRFCASKKRWDRGRWADAVHMAAALAGCRKALVGTGLGVSLLFDTFLVL